MFVYLEANDSDYSNTISFNFSTLPSNASITKIEISGGTVSSSGKGLAVPGTVTLVAPDGTKYENTWGVGNKITITNITNKNSVGVWNMYFYATNISSTDYSIVSYSNCKLTIYYKT